MSGGRRVFDLLRGPHATLLAFDWTGPLPFEPAHHISEPEAKKAYDVYEPALLLIRPDDYIGCATTDPADITAYRARIGR